MAWIERAKSFAYGELGLKPWEFGRLTIREFNELVTGHAHRTESQLLREASWVALLLNGAGHLKKPITRDEILGRRPKLTSGASTPNERAEEARRKRIEERRKKAHGLSRGSPR